MVRVQPFPGVDVAECVTSRRWSAGVGRMHARVSRNLDLPPTNRRA